MVFTELLSCLLRELQRYLVNEAGILGRDSWFHGNTVECYPEITCSSSPLSIRWWWANGLNQISQVCHAHFVEVLSTQG